MAKIKYFKGQGLDKLMRRKKPVFSVSGDAYQERYLKVCEEIQRKNFSQAQAVQSAKNLLIRGNVGDNLRPDIQDFLDNLRLDFDALNDSEFFSFNTIQQAIIPSILDETDAVIHAKTLVVTERHTTSYKPYNLFLNIDAVFKILIEGMFLLSEENHLIPFSYVLKILLLILNIKEPFTKELDELCTKIIKAIYEFSQDNHSATMEDIAGAIEVDENDDVLKSALEKLEKYKCINRIVNGYYLLETVHVCSKKEP
jgi:hypothetical protein